jgi:hypothetical protein
LIGRDDDIKGPNPQLAILMNLVAEVRHGLKSFRKTEKYLTVFEDRITRCEESRKNSLSEYTLNLRLEAFENKIGKVFEMEREGMRNNKPHSEGLASQQ